MRADFPLKSKLRFLLVIVLFVLGTVPVLATRFQNISAQSLSMAGFFLLLAGLVKWRRAHPYLAAGYRFLARQRELPSGLLICFLFSLFMGTAVLICWYCFSFLPTYTDSTAQYIHAKFVAWGKPFGIAGHPLREFFPVWLTVHGATWYSQYPPMHQTLLGIFYFFDIPWLHSPLEGALVLVLVYAIARLAYGEATARLAALLTLLCQFVLIVSAEFMNHTTALFFGTLLIFCYLRMLDAMPRGNRKRIYLWALAAGLSAGAAFLTRPLTAVGLTLPFALHALYGLWNSRGAYLKPCLIMGGAGLFCVGVQLWYNAQTTGEWLTYAYTRYHSNSLSRAMGYYKEGGVLKTFAKMQGDWSLLNVMFYEWSLPCSFFAMLVCLLPLKDRTTRLLVGVVVSHTLTNMFNQFHSTVFGPRYMFETSSALIILTALGIMRLPLLLRASRFNLPRGDVLRGIIALAIIAVFASGIIKRVPNNIRIYSRYMDSHVPFYYSMLEQSQKPALIFLGRGEKKDPAGKFRWMSWNYPPLDDAPVIFAYDRGDKHNRKLMDYYPMRHAYVENKGKLQPAAPAPAPEKKQP